MVYRIFIESECDGVSIKIVGEVLFVKITRKETYSGGD